MKFPWNIKIQIQFFSGSTEIRGKWGKRRNENKHTQNNKAIYIKILDKMQSNKNVCINVCECLVYTLKYVEQY